MGFTYDTLHVCQTSLAKFRKIFTVSIPAAYCDIDETVIKSTHSRSWISVSSTHFHSQLYFQSCRRCVICET